MNYYSLLVTLFLLVCGNCQTQPPYGFDYANYRDVMKGFLIGITVKDQFLDGLLKCLHDDPTLQSKFSTLMDRIDKLDFQNLPLTAGFLADLYEGVIISIAFIDLCAADNDEYDILFKKMYNMMRETMIKRLMLNFVSNPQMIFKDIQDAVDNYLNKKFLQLGKDLGDIMHLILTFAVTEPTSNSDIYLKLLKGFFTGLNLHNEVDNILGCIGEMPEVMEKLIAIVNELKKVDITDIQALIMAIMKAFQDMRNILKNLDLCTKAEPELKELIKKLLSIDIVKVFSKIQKDIGIIFMDLLRVKDAFQKKEYEECGKIVGNLIYRILLDPTFLGIA